MPHAMTREKKMKKHLFLATCALAASLTFQGCATEEEHTDIKNATLLRVGGGCANIDLYGGYAYCGHSDGLNVYAVGDGTNVTLVRTIPVVQSTLGFLAVTIKDDRLYTWNRPNLEVYDLTDPENPVVVFQEERGPIRDIIVEGPWLYAAGDDGIMFYDITDPVAPVLRSTEILGASSLWLEDTRLFADSGLDGFRIYDVTDPTTPVILGGWPEHSVEQALEVVPLVVRGSYAWGANDRGVLAFDVADPMAATRIDDAPNLFRPVRGLALHGDLLVVSQTQEGRHHTVEFRDIAADPGNPPTVHVWEGGETTALGYTNATIFDDFAEDERFFYLAGPGGLVIWKKGK